MRERDINVWLPIKCPLLGIWPATQACDLTDNSFSDPLVHGLVLNPLSHTSQGSSDWLGFFCLFVLSWHHFKQAFALTVLPELLFVKVTNNLNIATANGQISVLSLFFLSSYFLLILKVVIVIASMAYSKIVKRIDPKSSHKEKNMFFSLCVCVCPYEIMDVN